MTHEYALLKAERSNLILLKHAAPYRAWFAVKTATEVRFFDSKRKAMNFAKKNTPAAVYAAQ